MAGKILIRNLVAACTILTGAAGVCSGISAPVMAQEMQGPVYCASEAYYPFGMFILSGNEDNICAEQ